MPVRRVTIDDIARESGASPTTVSLVLRDKPGIGIETRDRVLAAAQALGYQRRPSRSATSGRGVRTVALLFRARHRTSDERAPGVNPFYSWVLTGLEAAARSRQMNLLYATVPVDGNNEIVDLPAHLLDQHLDGILAIGPFRPSVMDQLARANTAPLVALDGPANERGWSGVVSDNVHGAVLATRHLIERGHREIGVLSTETGFNANFDERASGFAKAMTSAGLPWRMGEIRGDDVASAVQQLLAERPETTAIFAANDNFALTAMRELRKMGKRVPEEISLIGFDDIDLAGHLQPGLSTMAIDKVSMGRLAIELLEFRLVSPSAATVVVTLVPTLIARESVAAPPDRL